jgi:hypothetical protein
VPTFRALCAESSYGDHPLDAVHKARHVGVRGKSATTPLYAQNPAQIFMCDRIDTVHKARQVGKDELFFAQNLDAFTL